MPLNWAKRIFSVSSTWYFFLRHFIEQKEYSEFHPPNISLSNYASLLQHKRPSFGFSVSVSAVMKCSEENSYSGMKKSIQLTFISSVIRFCLGIIDLHLETNIFVIRRRNTVIKAFIAPSVVMENALTTIQSRKRWYLLWYRFLRNENRDTDLKIFVTSSVIMKRIQTTT